MSCRSCCAGVRCGPSGFSFGEGVLHSLLQLHSLASRPRRFLGYLVQSRAGGNNAELTVRRPGARIAPMKSTRACYQTRLEKSRAGDANLCTSLGGRVRSSP